MTGRRTVLSWSGGKDCALALHVLRERRQAPYALLTTVVEATGAVSHHGIPATLLAEQAAATGLELVTVPLPDPCPDVEYAARMRAALGSPRLAGLEAVAFGDLQLADVRAWREERLAQASLVGEFPLFGRDTRAVAHAFLDLGFSAVVCAVDTEQLGAEYLGRTYDRAFLRDLPDHVDPAGEHGEFHTVVTDGPVFAWPVRAVVDGVEDDGRFARARLRPVTPGR